MHLRIHPPDGRISISAPHRMPLSVIQQFIAAKAGWITTRRQAMQARQPKATLTFADGEQLMILGQPYTLQVCSGTETPHCRQVNNVLFLHTDASESLEKNKTLVQAYLQQQLLHTLQPLLAPWEQRIGVEASELRVKAMKTRWGSCNIRTGRIWINLHLIHQSVHCIEYVLVHELIHLLEPSHNQRFYRFMKQFLPDWKTRHQELVTFAKGWEL